MSLFVEGIKGDSPAALQANINAFLAPLLADTILAVHVTCGDVVQVGGIEFSCFITYSDGGDTLTNPFQCLAQLGRTAAEAGDLAQAAIAAQPTYFWSGDFPAYAGTDGRRTRPYLALQFFNPDAAASGNWAADGTGTGGGGSTPTGPAGGDLTGTYPNPLLAILYNQQTGTIPAAATAIDSLSATTYGDIEWDLELVKGTTRYATLVRGNHDGTTANHTESSIVVSPGSGTFDFTISVDISGGNLRLVVTPSTTGWSYRYRRRALAA